MSRLFLLFAIGAVVYLLIRSFRKDSSRDEVSGQDEKIAEDMVRCAQCGVHLPKGESIQAEGHNFCGAEHRDLFLK